MDQTLSPAVLTSTAADNHINNVVKPALADATSGIQSQLAKAPSQVQTATTSATTNAPSTSTTAATGPLNTYSYIATDGTSKTVQAASPNEAMTKAGDIAAHSGVQLAPATPSQTAPAATTSPATTTSTPVATTTDQTQKLSDEQKQLDQANQDYQTQAKQVQDNITNIQNGTIPLNAGEQAQIAALQQSYQTLIDQQKLTNIGATGLANVRGYQTGAAEYDPLFQAKTIGTIVSAGQQKIADLNSKMAAAVAQLTQAFKDNDIKVIQDAWGVFKDASDKRMSAIQDTIKSTQDAIKTARDALQKQTDQINTVAQDLAKNGAPVNIIAAATNAGSVADAIQAGVGYFQDPTSTGGQYTQYVRDTQAKGLVPMSAADFLIRQEYRKTAAQEAAKNAAAGVSGGSGVSGAPVALNNAFSGAVLGLSAQQQKIAQQTYAKYIANGDLTGAKAYVLRVATQSMPTDQQNQAVGRYQAVQALSDIQTLIDQAKAKGVTTGILEGNLQNTAEKLGQQGDPALAEIGTRIAATLQTYRRSMTGVAFSPSEAKQYDAIFPSTTKNGDLNTTKINALKDALDSNNKAALSFYVGQDNYDSLYGKGSAGNVTADPKSQVDTLIQQKGNYVLSNGKTVAQTVSSLYQLPGWDDQKVAEYMNTMFTQ